jgi:membrane-bound serine protease (ClpP class)
MQIWLPILLFAVGFAALFVELFVPALGVIGGSGIICMIVSTVLAFRSFGNAVGTLFLVGTLVGTPALVLIGLKMFPRTFLGRKLILGGIPEPGRAPSPQPEDPYRGLVGAQGTALTTLRPSGMVMIGDRKYSVVTGGEMVDKGTPVLVTRVEGNRIVVRKLRPSDSGGAAEGGAGGPPGGEETQEERGTRP